MKATADDYYEAQNLMDFRLLSALGFTEADADTLRGRADISAVMAGQALDLLVDRPDGTEAVHISALYAENADDPANMDRPVLSEGRMPAAADECLVDGQTSYAIGDVITLSDENDADTLELMATRQFTVVGRASSPAYVALTRGNTGIGNGRISFYMLVHQSAFNSEYYTEILLTYAPVEGVSSFSPRYNTLIDEGQAALEALGEERAQLRYNEVVSDARAEIADAKAELADAKQEADEQLAEAWQEILDGEAEIADGWAEYRDGQQEIVDGEQEIADAEREIPEAELRLAEALVKLEDGQRQYDEAAAQYNAGYGQWLYGQQQLDGLTGAVAALRGPQVAMQAALVGGDTTAFATAAQKGVAGLQGLAANMQAAGQDVTALNTAIGGLSFYLSQGPGGYPTVLGLYTQTLDGLDATLADTRQTLDAAKAQLDTANLQLNQALTDLANGRAAYQSGLQSLQDARVQLADAKAELADGKTKLADAYAELTDAEKELADGKLEYADEKAKAETEIADAEAEIADAEQKLNELDAPEWFVRTRADNPGYSGFASDTERIDAIAVVIPVFFFLVAALVCLTTMTRMVEEQRSLIGTLKALGYSRVSIASKYLLYAAIASSTGALAGVAGGFVLFPKAIWSAYSIMYEMPALSVGNSPQLAVFSVLACVGCTTLATLAACITALRSAPSNLMRPKAPKAGKRVILERVKPLWNRLSFMAKVTVRNLFRYKKRFFMTIIGVAGCTALLLTGFGLRDSITGIVPRQYGGIAHYKIVAALSEPSGSADNSELNDSLSQLGSGLYVSETLVDAESPNGNSAGMTVYAYVAEQPERLADYITFRERKSQQPVAFPSANGAVVTEKLATRLKVEVGDTISLNRVNEPPAEIAVAGIVENYIFNYVYLTPAQYQGLFGQPPEYSGLLLNPAAGANEADTLSALIALDPVAGAVDIGDMEEQFNDMFEGLNAVVWLIIAAAGALAFVVLYNLTNINITERSREIATLKVLGFYNGEVASYVYRENLMLTLIGIALGLAMGVFLHDFVIVTAEIDEVMFRRVVEPLSYLWSVLFTLVSAGLVNLVMLPRLRKVDMVESLKSNE